MTIIEKFFSYWEPPSVLEEVPDLKQGSVEQQLSLCIPKIPWKTPFKFTSGIIGIDQCACTLPNTLSLVIDGGTSAEAVGKDIEANLDVPVEHWEIKTDFDDFDCWDMMIRLEKRK